MDKITLSKANAINDSIKNIESEISNWKKAVKFRERLFCETIYTEEINVCIDHLDFNKIKEMALEELQNQLEKLKKEFEAL